MAEIDHAAVSRHRAPLIGCLQENDPSIRRRALEVAFALVYLVGRLIVWNDRIRLWLMKKNVLN